MHFLDEHKEERFIKYYKLGYEEGFYEAKIDFNMYLRGVLEDLIIKNMPRRVDLRDERNDKVEEKLLIVKGEALEFAGRLKEECKVALEDILGMRNSDAMSKEKEVHTNHSVENLNIIKQYYNEKLEELGSNADEVKVKNAYKIGTLKAYMDFYENVR